MSKEATTAINASVSGLVTTTHGMMSIVTRRSFSFCLYRCGEEEVVRGVHTLVAGVVHVCHRLHVVEEEEKGRKVEQEVEREDQGEETAHTWMVTEMT